ncbi:FAD-binding oxidoreductase [Chitinophagaceae bacterium MMS25-I14]
MSEWVVKIREAYYINHDVKRFVLEKPQGFIFNPGQATNVSINSPGWEQQARPFTFTSLNLWDYLEFHIKIYQDHNSVTNELGKLNAGAELILHDVFGAIEYKGPGVFIAGGTGITPFLAILRQLQLNNHVVGNMLLFSNKYAEDVIFDEELRKMLGKNYISILTRENQIGFGETHINRDFLIDHIHDFSRNFYVCGPENFVTEICKLLRDLGVMPETLIFEH